MSPQHGGLPSSAANAKDHDWALFFRFVIISTGASLASIGNIFTISAIIIDDLLRKKGNSFLVSMTLADLLVTAIALPASSVAILSQMENSENLCRFQYAVSAMSCVTAAVFTAVVGVENFFRLRNLRQLDFQRRRRPEEQQQQQQQIYQHQHSSVVSAASTSRAMSVHTFPGAARKPYRCSQFQVTVLNLILWVFSGFLVLLHVVMMPQLMYATCGFLDDQGLDRQSLIQSLLVFAVCFTAFILVGGLGFLKCVCIMRSWDRPKPYLISREFALVTSNCWNWLARFLIWCPSLLLAIVSHSQESSLSSSSLSSSSTAEAVLHLGSSTASSSSYSSSISNFANIISTTMSPLLQVGSGMTSPSSTVGGLASNSSSRMSASELISLQRLLLWPAILPPCLSSLINAVSNRDFRRCYIQLFHYCCCKTSVALTRRSRDNLRGGSDVRVHIIPGYNIYNSSTGHFPRSRTHHPDSILLNVAHSWVVEGMFMSFDCA
ncbi:5-hydroxytryptamine receptor [Orchesella cincta]|uniref:5-hydroxytryptamine receptor n=1 Tax=Orchesella cincta TaxID=48709 RepID=A0A1D2NG13_ORCCI|nr:5-hydroxytryptamine receptor [Orchesella cincta]